MISLSFKSMEKFGIFRAKLNVPDGASFSPVLILKLQQLEKVPFDNVSEVGLWSGERPLILKYIKLLQSLIAILSKDGHLRDSFAPRLEGIAEIL